MTTYVSRAGHKLETAVRAFRISLHGKTVLDIGSSTGGFTDFALQNGATKVIAVELGTDQLHPSLRTDSRVELHEKTDIFGFTPKTLPDIITIDVSFLSLTKVLNYAKLNLIRSDTAILAMLKPQFEASPSQLVKGKVKNSRIRRDIIKHFEQTISKDFKIIAKQDNHLPGREEGNIERFYLLAKVKG